MGDASGWQPQPRPEWVTRMNQVGANLGSPELLVTLDEASLLSAATGATGLDDFGPDDEWREPFRILLADIDVHAELTLVGRILARFELLRSLVARLGMAEAERQHPEILEQEVVAPVFITGLGRTGTSILLELLAQDPAFRGALGWEQRYPSPPPEAARRFDDPRILQAEADIELWVQVVPEFLAMHESTSTGPDEDTVGLLHGFTSVVWSAAHRAPNYDDWLGGHQPQLMRHHHRMLRHLQFRSPGRWALKAPTHMACLPELFAEYPDARVIHTHRDPLKVLASTADMVATLRWQRSDRVDYDEFAEMICFGYPFLLTMVIDQRRDGVVPAERFADVRYADLMADHLGTVRRLYEALDLALSDEVASGMQAYLDARPKGRHGERRYRFADLGVSEADMRAQFASYMLHYGVPEEEL